MDAEVVDDYLRRINKPLTEFVRSFAEINNVRHEIPYETISQWTMFREHYVIDNIWTRENYVVSRFGNLLRRF